MPVTQSPPGAGKLAVLASGGPAPGINSVISAVTIRARLSGTEVIGIRDGFHPLMAGDHSRLVPLDIESTSRIHFRGGCYLGITRGSPAGDPAAMARSLQTLREAGITMLVTIGGDGTAFVACEIAKAAAEAEFPLRIVHVPKTIDNDIDLPHDISTFGFQTARHVGVDIVKNLMVDAKTTGRWYLVIAQGRKAGHLALAIGKAAGATLSVIPEEFRGVRKGELTLRTVVDTLVGSIFKRAAEARPRRYGVALLAEGLAELIAEDELLAYVKRVPRDAVGNVRHAQISIGDILQQAVRERLQDLGHKGGKNLDNLTVLSKQVGYELRSADPIPFDMEYTRDLGYCAARFILSGGTHAMVTMQSGCFVPIPLFELLDPDTGKPRVRLVDVSSDRYRIARTYMIRLGSRDFSKEFFFERELGLSAETLRAELGEVIAREDAFWSRGSLHAG